MLIFNILDLFHNFSVQIYIFRRNRYYFFILLQGEKCEHLIYLAVQKDENGRLIEAT